MPYRNAKDLLPPELYARNACIRAEAAQGVSLEVLSRRYHLAPSTLRHILHKKR